MSSRSESRAPTRPLTEIERLAGQVLMPGFVGPDCPPWLADALADGLGGLCLFGSNIESREQLADLVQALHNFGPDAVITIDEEGGDVSRLYAKTGSPAAGNGFLGRVDDELLTEQTMRAIGAELRSLGITMDLAPVADVNSNPQNPVIGVRSFGADTGQASRHVAAAVRGLQDAGVGAVVKHFPGHGDTAVDSHVGLPLLAGSLSELRERELRPFVAAVHAGVAAVMTAHLLVPALDLLVPALDPELPASLSAATTALLRHELGFDGLIVTDALDMKGASGDRGIPEAAVLALIAGAQLLCLGSATTETELSGIRAAIVAAVDSGRLTPATLEDAAAAVARFRTRFPAAGADAAGSADPVRTQYPVIPGGGFVVRGHVRAQERPLFIRLHGSFNHAAGDVAWGIGRHLESELVAVFPGVTFADAADLSEWDAILDDASDTGHSGTVVLGRNIGRDGFESAAVDRARSRVPGAIVVEMGWPTDDVPWDIATYGAGRGVSLALADLIHSGVGCGG